jgi:hypothetical protein
MIDPRALQQHFKKVNQRIEPKKALIPRISEIKPLTAIQTISVPESIKEPETIQPVIDTSQLQEELREVTQALATLKQSLSEASKIEPVTITVPVSVVVEEKLAITETETKPVVIQETKPNTKNKELKEEDNPYGYSITKKRDTEEYNPYGYYSGPRF